MALPDLEMDPDAVMEMERDVVGSPVLVGKSHHTSNTITMQRTMSDNVNDPPPVSRPTVASQDVLVRKEEVCVIPIQVTIRFMILNILLCRC